MSRTAGLPAKSLLLLLAAGTASAAISAAPAALDYVVRGDGVVAAVIGGQPARLRISPWAPAAPTLNPDFAQRIGLRGGLFGFAVKVGPVKVGGQSSVTRLEVSKASFRRRVVWFDRPWSAGADAAVGPGGLPVDVVRFELRAPQPGERTVALPLDQAMFRPSYGRVAIGKRSLIVLFDPQHRQTLATAGAGATLAESFGGQFYGVADRAEVAFGIQRPVRAMRLARPLSVGPLAIDRLLVRTGDNGSVAGIPDADADPEEIVVTAKGGNRRDVLIIGRDQLDRCSSITFDKKVHLIRMACV
ncbi:hypothetical protein [Sphingomonas sp. 28-63-12]|uniref:hypothetical protein n=1 Tax=Sphingomonas sp. 28-63-12 TaxID=1970434 RepID=UPI0035A855A1